MLGAFPYNIALFSAVSCKEMIPLDSRPSPSVQYRNRGSPERRKRQFCPTPLLQSWQCNFQVILFSLKKEIQHRSPWITMPEEGNCLFVSSSQDRHLSRFSSAGDACRALPWSIATAEKSFIPSYSSCLTLFCQRTTKLRKRTFSLVAFRTCYCVPKGH